ncbi:MAG: SMC-Scp complex subunit ScpB [Chitinispirillales bacterium]|nr:SMC-Scp complex subunit ScpB [Chitinispirillales bacterium]
MIDVNENAVDINGSVDDADNVNEASSVDDIDSANDTGDVDNVDKINDGESSEEEDAGAVTDTRRILEALLFASDELLTPAKLKTLIPGAPDARSIRKLAGEINERLSAGGHPFEIVEAGGGYQFRTLSAYHPWVRKLYKERAAKKLSLQALECLAIIAYRQPITKAEVEAIRGVLSDGAMKTLLERKLVDIWGRSEKPGRPLLYGTTGDFLKYFGINKLSDLPRIEEFEAMARAKMEEMEERELLDGMENSENVGEDEGAVNTHENP